MFIMENSKSLINSNYFVNINSSSSVMLLIAN